MLSKSYLLALPITLVPLAGAQSLSIVAMEGDAVPGVGTITRVDGVQVADDGSLLIEVDTDNADTAADSVLLLDGAVLLREGDLLAQPAGASIGSFDGTSLRPGRPALLNLFLDGTTGLNDDSGLFLDGQIVLQEGAASGAVGFSPGTNYIGFFDVEYATDSSFLVVASIDDPNIASSVDRALVVVGVDAAGMLLSETIVVKEGDVLPGQTEAVADIETNAEESAINSFGSVIYGVDLEGDNTVDRALYLDQTLLIQEGSPSPIAGRNWGSLLSVEVDLNDSGDWVAKTNLDTTDTSTDDVLVKNGSIFQRAGGTLPAIAPFTLTDFGGSNGVWITAFGDVVWFGDWDDPDESRDEGIFVNDQLVLQEGVTQIGGQTIVDLSDITEQIAVSPNGDIVLVEGEITVGGTDLDVVVQIRLGLGTRYCPNLDNSTGRPTSIGLSGSDVVADNDLTLLASNLPSNAFGFFFASRTPGLPMGPPSGIGNVCLAGFIGRFVGPGQIQNSMTTGAFALPVDLTVFPQPNGFVSVQPGETWFFQAWHRDVIGGVTTSRLSDAIELTFL